MYNVAWQTNSHLWIRALPKLSARNSSYYANTAIRRTSPSVPKCIGCLFSFAVWKLEAANLALFLERAFRMSLTKCWINISVSVLELQLLSPSKGWPGLSVWHFCALGLGAEGMVKLSGNILSHAETPCLVAQFSPFLPAPVLPLP